MKQDWEIYRDTGMLGAYEPGYAFYRSADEGKVATGFRDAAYWDTESGMTQEREMFIGNQLYHITSVFPSEETSTPTDKMLALIDSEISENAGNKD